jgi:signal transduction histidine kinase
MQLKLERLEQQHAIEKERTRIAQDMHDDFGARLTEILLVTAAAKKSGDPDAVKTLVGRISNSVEDISGNLDAIIWAVNPRNDQLEKFAQYICGFAETFLEPSGIRLRLDVPEVLPNHALSSELRHNLYLVIKEALNNAVKYSRASEISFRMQAGSGALSIAIADNGKGFCPDASSSRGNGLVNMEERMKKIGGTIEILSEPGSGTRVQFKVPLKVGA